MATLKLFGGGLASCIPNYTLVPGLLFDVVAETPDSELSPHEKLFVVQAIGQEVHAGYLADIYMKCGCFAEARAYYISPEHPRKLGDICWCEGKLDEAEAFYLKPVSAAQFYRGGPDTDRLIKLAFLLGSLITVNLSAAASAFIWRSQSSSVLRTQPPEQNVAPKIPKPRPGAEYA